jgi:predicted TIM-barrel fold metal-dependent hydrolase
VIIDSQVHVWPPKSPERVWVRDEPHLPEPLSYQQLLGMMDEAGVDAAILVPPSWEGDRNDYCLEAAHAHPDRFAVMGRLALAAPEAREEVETLLDDPGMLGVRLTFHRPHHRVWMTDGTADWFWPAAERLNIPVMLHVPHSLAEVAAIAGRHPALRLIIDHMGMGRESSDDALAGGVARLSVLAPYPNVAVKVSSLPCFSTQPYPFRNVLPYVQRVVEAFGPKRCFWGTDLSRTLPICSYRDVVTTYTEHMPFLSADDLEWIMGRALSEFLNWPRSPGIGGAN